MMSPATVSASFKTNHWSTTIPGPANQSRAWPNPITVSPDGKTVRFVLRKGLKWSDGEPLNADDVVFTYGKLVKEAYGDPSHRDTLSVTGDYP